MTVKSVAEIVLKETARPGQREPVVVTRRAEVVTRDMQVTSYSAERPNCVC